MTPSTLQTARMAQDLEAELDEYPEERGDILVEAAGAWHGAGEHERAIALLTEAKGLGDEDGGIARVSLADVLYDLGRVEQAEAELAAMRRERPASPLPYALAGELLEERGDLRTALTCFNMGVSRLSDEEMARLRRLGTFSYASTVIGGRHRVRRALNMPADDLDELAQPRDNRPFASAEQVAESLADGRPPNAMRVLFWPRSEVARAHERWPDHVGHCDGAAASRERERANRELSESGVARIVMVPLTVARLEEFVARTGGDPCDDGTRKACLEEIVADGKTISWPPPRNGDCWCGSGTKYKKCCGHPVLE